MTKMDTWDSNSNPDDGTAKCPMCCPSKTNKHNENIENKTNRTGSAIQWSTQQPKPLACIGRPEATCTNTSHSKQPTCTSAIKITQDTPPSRTDMTQRKMSSTHANNIPLDANASSTGITSQQKMGPSHSKSYPPETSEIGLADHRKAAAARTKSQLPQTNPTGFTRHNN